MSQENVEIVKRVYDWVNDHLELPTELLAPDCEVDATEVAADVGVVRQPQAAEAFASYWATFDDYSVEMLEVIHADEVRVIGAVRDGGRIKGSDAEVWNRFFHVWTFGDGKITRFSTHTDRNRALQAAGLQE